MSYSTDIIKHLKEGHCDQRMEDLRRKKNEAYEKLDQEEEALQ